jgi:hypothetical protein
MSAIEDDYARLVGQGDVAEPLKRLLVGLLHRIDPQGGLEPGLVRRAPPCGGSGADG